MVKRIFSFLCVGAILAGMLATRRVVGAPPSVTLRALQE